ncbi:hypothetical protein A3Q56_08686, partial [Intoshia linei]
ESIFSEIKEYTNKKISKCKKENNSSLDLMNTMHIINKIKYIKEKCEKIFLDIPLQKKYIEDLKHFLADLNMKQQEYFENWLDRVMQDMKHGSLKILGLAKFGRLEIFWWAREISRIY